MKRCRWAKLYGPSFGHITVIVTLDAFELDVSTRNRVQPLTRASSWSRRFRRICRTATGLTLAFTAGRTWQITTNSYPSVNVGCGPAEERILLTGLHAVADIYCECCKTTLGWKYEHAFESSQKYKEGKYIIEMAHMIKENGWESPPKK
ncbi:hypothetical protein ACI65C_002474 [Semiaphis heraclei]